MQTNFEELQAAWKDLDKKWAAQKTLSERLVLSMISERSGSALTAMGRKKPRHGSPLPVLCLLFCGLHGW